MLCSRNADGEITSGEVNDRAMPQGRYDYLRDVPYFARLNDDLLSEIARLALTRRFGSGDVLLLEGERNDGLYLLRSGRVRIYKTSPEGREQVLAIVGPGESFNEVPVFDDGPNPASAQALEESEAFCLQKGDIQALLRRSPSFAAAVVQTFASRLRQLSGLVEDLSFRHVTARVAKIILAQDTETPARRLTQQQMAAMAGTAREVVGRVLKSLELEGIVKVGRGRVVVLDRARLEKLA
jgi:CRP-like cAMP-binding protein